MPELPEVETTRRGLAPHVEGRCVRAVTLRRPDLRWPIPAEIRTRLPGQRIDTVRRRAKYLLLDTDAGSALLHLGMSGSLRVLPADVPAGTHDHVDLALDSGRVLRFNDPRRFGCLLWQAPGTTHELLRGLGPEPLSEAFHGDYLFAVSRGRKAPVKTFLMDHAIARGGTTLRDFLAPDGAPGYFEQELAAYGRGGEPCPRCGRPLKQAVIGQRTTVWCGTCQR